MSYVIQVVLSNARHPEYGQFTIPFPIPQDAYDDMVEALKNMEIGDPILQDCHVDELESSYSILKRLEKTNLNLDELDYLAKRLDSFDNGEAAQFQGMACKLGVSNIKDFINLTFCCQQATVITDFSDLDAIGRQHYMTMQGGGCRTEELERLDSRKFALDLILNHTEGSITPYGVVYDNGMKLEPLYDGRHFPCYHYQQDLLAVGLSSGQRPENTGQITWLLLPCSEQQLRRGIERFGVDIHDACIWYEDSMLPPEVEEVLVAFSTRLAEHFRDEKDSYCKRQALRALDYIEEHYKDSDVTLNSVCSYLAMSTSYFSSIFKNYTGETFIEALTRKRVEKAKFLLENTSRKNYEIACDVGYSDPHYFSNIFKKATGMTPTEYARKVRK